MLGSISPVGEAARRQRWGLTASAHLAASAAGGAVAGGLVAGIAQLAAGLSGAWVTAGTALAVLGAGAVIGALVDRSTLAVPSWQRQVDERWLTVYRGWVYGAGFGFQLGLGVVTIVPSAITYVALLAAFLTGSWQAGLLVGAAFGVARALPVVLSGVLARSTATLHGLVRDVAGAEAAIDRATVAAQVTIAGIAGALAVGMPA